MHKRSRAGKPDGKVIQITYDPEADAAYIYTDNTGAPDHTEPLDHGIMGDYDADGKLIGLEVLWVRDQLAKYLRAPKPENPVTLNIDGTPERLVSPEENERLRQKFPATRIESSQHPERHIRERLNSNDPDKEPDDNA